VQQYSNQIPAPQDQPRRPQGSYPVIIRQVRTDLSEEWRSGSAIRWTPSGAVMVSWQEQPGDPRSVVHAWLPLADVARVSIGPRSDDAGAAVHIRRPTQPRGTDTATVGGGRVWPLPSRL